jgi:hypothetical protein
LTWTETLTRMIEEIARPDSLPRAMKESLKDAGAVYVMCSVHGDAPESANRRLAAVCEDAAMRMLHDGGFALATEGDSLALSTTVEIARAPSGGSCVFNMQSRLLRVVLLPGAGGTVSIELLWRAVPICAATDESRLERDLDRLLRAQLGHLVMVPEDGGKRRSIAAQKRRRRKSKERANTDDAKESRHTV